MNCNQKQLNPLALKVIKKAIWFTLSEHAFYLYDRTEAFIPVSPPEIVNMNKQRFCRDGSE